MKQFTIFNQLTAMPKRLAMVLTVLFTLGVGSMLGATWEKATSISAGDVVLLVCESKNYELKSFTTSGTIYGEGDAYSTTPEGLYELTVEAGSSDGTFSFKNGSKYLYWSSENSLATNATKSANTSWTITFSNGNAIIKNAKDATRQLQWNASSPRFACYTSSQTAVQLYKKSATVNWTINPAAGGSLSATTGNSITVTPNTAYTYGNPAYTVSPAGKATVSQSTNTFTATPTENCTIQINMVEKPKYTVTLSAGPGSCAELVTETSAGEGVTLPTPTLSSACQLEGWSFAGWTTSSVANETTAAPTTLLDEGSNYKPTDNCTLCAVYSRTEEGEGGGSTPTEESKTYTFSDYKVGTQYAEETYELDDDVTINIKGCHINTQLRVYGGQSGIVISEELPGRIVSMGFNMGYKADKLVVSGSTDGTSWNEVGSISTTTSYKDYTLDFGETNYTYFKLNVEGNNQIRIAKMSIIYESTSGGGSSSTTYYHSTPDCGPTTCTVTFNDNGHGTAPTAQTVENGQKATEPTPAPTATGYTFGGWYKEAGCTTNKFDFNTSITADITLYAKWTPITYTVSFDKNGGTGTMNSQTFTYDAAQNLTANSFTRTGYTFNGWNTQSDGLGDSYTNSQSVKNLASTNGATITLYAQWKVQTFTVTFNKNSGTGTMNNQTFTYNVAQALTANSFTRTGYTFNGWNTKSDGSGNSYTDKQSITLTAAGLTLYAQWTANTYTVEFNANGGTGSMDNQSFTYGQSQALSANAFTRTNYVFKHWTINQDGTGTSYTDGQSVSNLTAENGATITLYAQWTPVYTITWVANDQSHHTQTAEAGTALAMPSAPDVNDYDACDDKVFVGWTETQIVNSTNTKPSDLFTNKSGTLTANKTYYAVFATAEGAASTDYEKITDINDLTDGNYVIAYGYNTTTPSIILKSETKSETTLVATSSSPSSNKYQNPAAENIWSIKKNGTTYTLYNEKNSKYIQATTTPSLLLADANPTNFVIEYSSDHWKIKINGNTSYQLVGYTNASGNYFQTKSGASASYKIQLYKNTSTVTYSEYVTSCVAVPDPVLSFVTTPADPIEFDPVNCGGTTTKAQAKTVQVSGAYLQEYVSVEVTGPYKIAKTSSTNLSDYTTSLTLDITQAGAINANYSTVYIISCPPAQSTDATTGTLTFTTKKGNTLTVNLSTPTVNCTTYALTFNDRGNKTVENYYAGASVPQPADPTGVCTDPIHYVFDGWAEASVANGSTEYTKVTFPYTMPGQNKTLYAVYRYLTSGGNGDYNLVTSALDDWSGDYLIAYSDQIFANGKIGGKEGIGAAGEKVDLSSYITNNTIPAAEGDKYKVSLEAINGGYLLKTQDGQYNYQSSNTNGLEATTNKNTATNYKLSVNFESFEEINLCLSGNAEGAIFQYNTDQQGYFRFYKNGGQQPVYLYKKADGTTLYTSAPVCGPYVEITSGKDIYVTGGNAGGTHDLVVAQQKVAYQATRLKKDNETGNLPSIQVRPANITYDATKTKNVTITFDEDSVRTLQSDDTYTISGTMTISYRPEANNVTDDIQVVLNANYNPSADVSNASFTIHARSLPQEFVIVAKQGDKWYALNGDMSNGSSANPANGQVVLDDATNPTKATYAPCNTIYTFDGLPNTGDRTRVRFQGIDGAWLWAASGTNTGIQNKSLKTTPSGNMEETKAYNWKLETSDNITYKFHNDNSSRLLGLSGEKFGMYASAVNDIRILLYEAKCLYNYAPTNLKVSVLKGSYVTLTWDAVAGATKYQYSDDATNWTDAGSDPTVTINGLTRATNYTYYIRAYHEDAGVSQECFDYSELTFTTADCDDVPSNITYTSSSQSITISWEAEAETSTVRLYSDKEGKEEVKSITSSSPCTISDLEKYTTYYVQILAGGTCPSQIKEVSTLIPNINIAEWMTDGILVDVDTDEDVSVIIENEESYGSGSGQVAEELFFSKYFEGSGSLKLLAIYNGTGKDVDLSTYRIDRGSNGNATNISKTYDLSQLGTIKNGQEIIFYSWPLDTDAEASVYTCSQSFLNGKTKESGVDANPRWILCDANPHNGVEFETMDFSGDDPLLFYKGNTLIDVFGVSTAAEQPSKKTQCSGRSEESWSAAEVTNMDYGKTEADFEGGVVPEGVDLLNPTITAYTARVIMFRKNTVLSGSNAVAENITDFVTLASEWEVRSVCKSGGDGDLTCSAYQELGKFNYSEYYTKYETVGEKQVFPGGDRKDGTVKITIEGLSNYSCHNIKLNLQIGEDLKLTETTKVPILISDEQTTDITSNVFKTLKSTLGVTNPQTHEKRPLEDNELKEKCETCDIVVLANGKLTHGDEGIDQFNDLTIYPEGVFHNTSEFNVNRLLIHAKKDDVGYAIIENEGVSITTDAIAHTKRIDAQYWYPFSLPYNCNIADITQANGEPLGDYGVHWGIQYYDGKKRQESGTSAGIGQSSNFWTPIYDPTEQLNAYQGYMIALFDAVVNSQTEMRTIYFPPVSEQMYTESGTDSKETTITSWNVNLEAEKRHHGWNFTGSPYISVFNPQADGLSEDFGLLSEVLIVSGHYDQGSNEYLYDDEYVYVSIPSSNGAKYYDQYIASATSLKPFTAYFVQAIDPNPTSGNDETQTLAYAKAGRELPSSAPRRSTATRQRVLVELGVTAPDGQTDNTGIWVDEKYTSAYEIAADLTKMYVAGDRPQLYTMAADNEKMAYNALPDEMAGNVQLGLYAPTAGSYTLFINERVSRLKGVERVDLLYNNVVVADLLSSAYVIDVPKKGAVNGYTISVCRKANVTTAIDNISGQPINIITGDGYLTLEGIVSDVQVSVYDMLGRLVAAQNANDETNIRIPFIVQGVYNVVVKNEQGMTTIKVVLR